MFPMGLDHLCHQEIPLILTVLRALVVQETLQVHLVLTDLEIQENQVHQYLQLGQLVLESQPLQVIQLVLQDLMIQMVLEVPLVLEALVILADQNCLHFPVVPKVQVDQADQMYLINKSQNAVRIPLSKHLGLNDPTASDQQVLNVYLEINYVSSFIQLF